MVVLRMNELMVKNNISRYKLQQVTNWNYKRINSLYFSKMKYLTVDEIDVLCKLFDCDVDDLICVKK